MAKIELYSSDKFISLQKRVLLDLKLTRDNIQDKILELPILYTKYKKLYIDQRQILNNIRVELKKTKAKKYHDYKFHNDFNLNTTSEINIYVDGDDEICQLHLLLDTQECIVDFLNDTVSQITKMGYLIKPYVDLEKMRNGIVG